MSSSSSPSSTSAAEAPAVAAAAASSAQAATTTTARHKSHNHHHSGAGAISRMVRWTGRTMKTSFAAVGVAGIAACYLEYRILYPSLEEDHDAPKDENGVSSSSSSAKNTPGKKVLVVPFHRLRLMEHKKRSHFLSSLAERLNNDEEGVVDMELRELVDLIHAAAADPTIGALFGTFGHAGGQAPLLEAGWADLEEVRNALRVFRESHRRHAAPNVTHQAQVIPRVSSKPLYAYADTWSSPVDPGNKEYYLASMFTHVHMQQAGELNLFGIMSQQFFVRGFLERHGILLHVFKHGPYKNAPNMFTAWGFNKPHRDNVANILEQLQAAVCDDIVQTRGKALGTAWGVDLSSAKRSSGTHAGVDDDNDEAAAALWQRIFNAGTFTAQSAYKAGLIDCVPRRDPLFDLVKSNQAVARQNIIGSKSNDDETRKQEIKAQWQGSETDFDRFGASQMVTLQSYAKQRRKQKLAAKRKQAWIDRQKRVEDALEKWGLPVRSPKTATEDAADSPALPQATATSTATEEKDVPLSSVQEEIALVHVTGAIGDQMARKVVNSIRKIRDKQGVKCVVLRVTSPGGNVVSCETILQELKSLKIPVVVSFGNVSASGGYYISAAAERIFASSKTITGSIGVFGIRADLRELAAQYGINVEHISMGKYSGSYSPFHKMDRKMRDNFSASIDRMYSHFKSIVSEGRKIPLEDLDGLAEGRVWTGDQAKTNGLIDEIGGLHRAIAYAQRNYTESGQAEVVVWPKERAIYERIMEEGQHGQMDQVLLLVRHWMATGGVVEESSEEHYNHAGDLTHASSFIQWFLQSLSGRSPQTLSGVMMASDENTAIGLLLQSAMGGHAAAARKEPLPPPWFWD